MDNVVSITDRIPKKSDSELQMEKVAGEMNDFIRAEVKDPFLKHLFTDLYKSPYMDRMGDTLADPKIGFNCNHDEARPDIEVVSITSVLRKALFPEFGTTKDTFFLTVFKGPVYDGLQYGPVPNGLMECVSEFANRHQNVRSNNMAFAYIVLSRLLEDASLRFITDSVNLSLQLDDYNRVMFSLNQDPVINEVAFGFMKPGEPDTLYMFCFSMTPFLLDEAAITYYEEKLSKG